MLKHSIPSRFSANKRKPVVKTYLFPQGRLVTRHGGKHPAWVIYHCMPLVKVPVGRLEAAACLRALRRQSPRSGRA